MYNMNNGFSNKMVAGFVALIVAMSAGAMEYKLKPNGTEDMTAEILAAVEKVKADKDGGTITLKSGNYYLKSPVKSDIWVSNHDNPRPRQIFLPIEGVTNLTIRSEKGARLLADGEGICLALIDTKNVKLEGVYCDYVRPFFSIWTLKDGKLTTDEKKYPYEIENGTIYTVGNGWRQRQGICELFDKDTHAFRGSIWWNGSAEKVFAGHPDGTIAMTRNVYRPSPCVFLYRASNTAFIRCGALAAAGMGFLAQRSENILLDGWRTHLSRPLALQADATHFSNCRGHVKVVNSVFEGMVDDAINVHSTSLKIIEKCGDSTIYCQYMHHQSVGFEVFKPGETLRFIKGKTMEPGAEVKVASVKMLAHNHIEIRLAEPIPEQYDILDAVENADWQPRVTFSKNIVRNSTPRATLFTTPGKVVCSDNLFENVAGQPIYFAGDAWDWYESGASRDVVVSGNTFRNCAFKSGRAMIEIDPAVKDIESQQRGYHQNILIENNTFENFTKPLVWAKSCENVVLKNNRIVNGNNRIERIKADVRFE